MDEQGGHSGRTERLSDTRKSLETAQAKLLLICKIGKYKRFVPGQRAPDCFAGATSGP
jgi:hypothetical protein